MMEHRPLPWFRFYSEAIDDEKLGLLAFEDRWHFVALLCLKCKGVLDSDADDELLRRKVALKLGLTCAELENVLRRLSKMGLVDFFTLQPIAWDNRQMQSDSSTARVQAFREKKKRPCNVSETAQEVDLDLDLEKEEDKDLKPKSKPLSASPRVSKQDDPIFEEAWAAYPKRPNNSKTAALKAWTARVKNGVDPADMILGVKRYAKYCEAMRTEPNYIKQASTFFGPDQHYLNDFDAKPSTGKAGMSPETKEFFNTNYDQTEAVKRQREHAKARGLDYDNIKDEDLIF